MQYYTKSGQIYVIGDLVSKEARGGEGSVHSLPQDIGLVAKLYRADLGVQDISRRGRKIEAMLSKDSSLAADQTFAWPLDALYDEKGIFAGYIMRSAADKIKLSRQLSDKLRKSMSLEELIVTACNLARTIESAHAQSYVIGDLKPENMLVSKAVITVIDVDSFQFSASDELFPCRAGTPEWLPPELQNVSFTDQSFSLETDRWALAVIIFKLLMNDTHPFTHRVIDPNAERTTQKENVVSGVSAHFPETNKAKLPIARPLMSPSVESLPPDVRNLFEQAFIVGHLARWDRPCAADWIDPLQKFRKLLKRCDKNPSHQYWQEAAICPWCEIEEASGSVVAVKNDMKTCLACGTNNKANAAFCSSQACGSLFDISTPSSGGNSVKAGSTSSVVAPSQGCRACGRKSRTWMLYCSHCGGKLSDSGGVKNSDDTIIITISAVIIILIVFVMCIFFSFLN